MSDYATVVVRGHPRADKYGRVLEHIVIAEKALGRPLPARAVVHHTDERCGQVDPLGLVICPNDQYHRLLHQRSRALAACGNANWRKCQHCGQYDAPENLYLDKTHGRHLACMRTYYAQRMGRKLMHEIRVRIGDLPELAGVRDAIDEYTRNRNNKQRKAA